MNVISSLCFASGLMIPLSNEKIPSADCEVLIPCTKFYCILHHMLCIPSGLKKKEKTKKDSFN